MSFLIDTHIVVWLESQSPKLLRPVREMIEATEETVFVSAASFWEIATKRRIGKLSFHGSIRKLVATSGFQELAMAADDAELAGGMNWSHKDPFDRFLAAQCINRGLRLVTAEAAFRDLAELAIVWAR